MAAKGEKTDGTCTNCGRPEDGLEEVRRVYVTVDDAGRVTGTETVAEPERWCRTCRATYPHEPLEASSTGGPGGDDPPADGRSS